METITARTNPLMTHLRRLSSSGSYRRQQGQLLADSPKLLHEALSWKAGAPAGGGASGSGAPGCDGLRLPYENAPGRAVHL